jgi:Tfp pilus assembly protein PilX
MHTRGKGFALLAVLAMLAIVGLFAVAALRDALFGTVLGSTRTFQQRAFELADLGIERALQQLSAATTPVQFTRSLGPLPVPTESTSVELRYIGAAPLAAGFSTDRIVMQRFEIHSTGHAARSAVSDQVQGVVRLVPASLE